MVFGLVPRFGYAFVISFLLVHCLPRNWVNSLLGEVSCPQQLMLPLLLFLLMMMIMMGGMMRTTGMLMMMALAMASSVMSSKPGLGQTCSHCFNFCACNFPLQHVLHAASVLLAFHFCCCHTDYCCLLVRLTVRFLCSFTCMYLYTKVLAKH